MSDYLTKQLSTPITLQCGATLDDVTVAYECFGKLNEAKDNAIMICHALTGDSHVTESVEAPKEGWWNDMVGPGKHIDTNKFYVICSNVLGSCKGSMGPGTINQKTSQKYGLSFPVITVKDIVSVQYQLCIELGIPSLYAVVGPSMGGMQALEWAISYSKYCKRCVVIASSSSLSPQALAFGMVGRNAIISDRSFNEGNYDEEKPKQGLAIARMIGHITYLSKKSITDKFGRKLQEKKEYNYELDSDFQIESYLHYQGDKFVESFDANSYLYLSKALSYFDLSKEYGSLKKAFEKISASMLFISISSDWLYPTEQSKEMARTCMNMNKKVTFCEVESDYGHDSFLIEVDKFGEVIHSFIEREL
ncbi:homoserine O-acetyltransferase [Candidatus Marinamargulisbacteria bacterium SCGC AG-343-D04]|nr:homoserine O-acetyltransferase [Candidatus Marinamargulisbacteria bacterium SCGC AG-343-D04]